MTENEALGVSRRAVGAWALVALWTVVVWGLGGDGGAAPMTSRILGPLLAWLVPDAAPERVALWIAAIRKTAHVVEYGVLALLALRALGLAPGLRGAGAVAAALAWVAVVAVCDEVRQASSPVRTGSAGDVVLDLAGGAGALALGGALRALRGRAGGSEAPR